jgi:predicted alpha/beta-hydrolase family hydrolase
MSNSEVLPFELTPPGEVHVRGFLHVPESPSGDGVVLTHGAGANCQSPLLITLATAFSESGTTVLRCDLPFRQLRPHGPPSRGSAERDQHGLLLAVEAMRERLGGRVFLGGHSYGGRQASMLAAAQPGLVAALLLLSYPLHPPKRADQPRTAHFPSLCTPSLFVHGTRDGFGSIQEMRAALELIPVRTDLLVVDRVGHELVSARTKDDVARSIVQAFWRFVAQ